jgi:hypothetical protein
MKKYSLILIFFLPLFVIGQTLEDALRYTQTNNFATARSMGVSGSFGAMGADFSTITYNPASLGNYWRSEFNVSLGYSNGYTNSQLGKKQKTNFDGKFNFNSIGFVTNSHTSSSGIVSSNFAIGLVKKANLYNYIDIAGKASGSILESPDVIDQSSLDYSQYNDIPISKHQIVEESGNINELILALGGNYKKRLLFGFSLGVPFLNYSTKRKYNEKAPDDLWDDENFFFRTIDFKETYTTVGVGINLKAGATYILPQNFRIGFAMHTPTSYRLKDDYTKDFIVDSRNYYIDTIANAFYFDYKYSTPWKFIGSAGKIFKINDISGFVNFDAEYVGYDNARYNLTKYSSDEYDAENERFQNDEINNKLRSTFNFRLGSEIAFKKLRFRLGGALNGSPFAYSDGYNPDLTYSAGLGYRGDEYYIDVAYLTTTKKYSYQPYTAEDPSRSNSISIDKYSNNIALTLGVKF